MGPYFLPFQILVPTPVIPVGSCVLGALQLALFFLAPHLLPGLHGGEWPAPLVWALSSFVPVDAFELMGGLLLLAIAGPAFEGLAGTGAFLVTSFLLGAATTALGAPFGLTPGGFLPLGTGLFGAVWVLAPGARVSWAHEPESFRHTRVHDIKLSLPSVMALLSVWEVVTWEEALQFEPPLGPFAIAIGVLLTYVARYLGLVTSDWRAPTPATESRQILQRHVWPKESAEQPETTAAPTLEVASCPTCGRTLSKRTGRCIYCG